MAGWVLQLRNIYWMMWKFHTFVTAADSSPNLIWFIQDLRSLMLRRSLISGFIPPETNAKCVSIVIFMIIY